MTMTPAEFHDITLDAVPITLAAFICAVFSLPERRVGVSTFPYFLRTLRLPKEDSHLMLISWRHVEWKHHTEMDLLFQIILLFREKKKNFSQGQR